MECSPGGASEWKDHDVAGVITASAPSWTAPFTGLSPRAFGKLITALRREGVDAVRRGRPWSLPLEGRVLPVTAYWRTNLTLRQLAPPFGVSKSAADRIIDDLGPPLALQPRRRYRKGHRADRGRHPGAGELPRQPGLGAVRRQGRRRHEPYGNRRRRLPRHRPGHPALPPA